MYDCVIRWLGSIGECVNGLLGYFVFGMVVVMCAFVI